MWRSKKVIAAVLMVVALLVGTTAGVVFAQGEDGDQSQPKSLLTRVSEILGIEQQALEDAFAEARNDMLAEAMQDRLQNLVDEGKITQEEADQYSEWWASKPDVPLGLGLREPGGFGGEFPGRFRGGLPGMCRSPSGGEPPAPPQ